jgi:hypothetical protein
VRLLVLYFPPPIAIYALEAEALRCRGIVGESGIWEVYSPVMVLFAALGYLV